MCVCASLKINAATLELELELEFELVLETLRLLDGHKSCNSNPISGLTLRRGRRCG